MTLSLCDQVAERTALGEPLGELGEHVEGCGHCQSLVAVSSKLGATRHAVDPGLGFSARMTVGAQQRIVARRRRRVAAGLAATVVAGGFGVLFVAHTPEEPRQAIAVPLTDTQPTPSVEETDPTDSAEEMPAEDDDIAALVELADVGRNTRLSADWGHINKPLAPYKKLLKGVTP
jgi:hypothetical protein